MINRRRRFVLGCGVALALAVAPAVARRSRTTPKDAEGRTTSGRKLVAARAADRSASPRRASCCTAELVGRRRRLRGVLLPDGRMGVGRRHESESTVDCEPYEAGKSEIKRRFTVEHIFRRAGSYQVYFRLKRSDKARRHRPSVNGPGPAGRAASSSKRSATQSSRPGHERHASTNLVRSSQPIDPRRLGRARADAGSTISVQMHPDTTPPRDRSATAPPASRGCE